MAKALKALLEGAPEGMDDFLDRAVDLGSLEPNWRDKGSQSAVARLMNSAGVASDDPSPWRVALLVAASNHDHPGKPGKPVNVGTTEEGWPLNSTQHLRYAMREVLQRLEASQSSTTSVETEKIPANNPEGLSDEMETQRVGVQGEVAEVLREEVPEYPQSLKGLLRYARRRHLLARKGKEGWIELAAKILCRIERHPRVKTIKESLRAIHEVAEATAKGRRIPIREDVLHDSLRCIWELLEEWHEWPPEDEGEMPSNVAPAASSDISSAVNPSVQSAEPANQTHNNPYENLENPLGNFLEAEEARMEKLLKELKPSEIEKGVICARRLLERYGDMPMSRKNLQTIRRKAGYYPIEFVCRRLINGMGNADWTLWHLEWFIFLAQRVIAELSLEEGDPWGGRATKATNDPNGRYDSLEFPQVLGEGDKLIAQDGRVFRDMGRWRQYMDMED